MRSSTFARTPAGRALALGTAVGVLALGGPTMPAVAQGIAKPPEINPAMQPSGGALQELSGFSLQQACMQGNPGGGLIEEKPWGQLALGFEEAHTQYRGEEQRIAVIDTGINNHPRLAGRIADGGSNVPGGALTDCDGHGTAVAGVIAASEDPTTGFVGVAPAATVISLRQTSANYQNQESGQTIGTTETMAQAVQHAIEMDATVINLSQSSCQPMSRATQYGDDANQRLHNAVKNAVEQHNIVVVAAAGNTEDACKQNAPGNPTTAVLPAWFDEYVLAVASVNSEGAPSQFSVAGPWVDVAAPGENITTLDPGARGTGLANQIAPPGTDQPGPINGTSFAAPYVAGLAALIKQKYPGMPAKQVMERIKKTALHPGGDDGRNDLVGYGMINPMAALDNVIPAEHNAEPAKTGPARLGADVIPQPDWPALLVAFGGALGGIGAVIFTAFLVNAVRSLRARRDGVDPDSL